MNFRNLLPICLLSGAIFISCSNEDCQENKNTLPQAGFYSYSNPNKSLSIDSLTVYADGAPNDSLLLNNGSSVSNIYLPFDLEKTNSSFVFKYNFLNGLEDKITFKYEAQPYFVSSACGVSYKFHIKEIEHTSILIDSVAVPGNMIDNTNKINIEIFFHNDEE